MNARDDFDRYLEKWLAETAGGGAIDYLDDALVRTSRTGQRRARWEPWRGRSFRWAFRPASVRQVAWLLLVLALMVAMLVAIVAFGSLRRLPAPYGLARNGVIAFDTGGDIYVSNPEGTARHLLLTAASSPLFSHDGTHIAFWHDPTATSPGWLTVADADGSHPVSLTGPGAGNNLVAADAVWSPDSRTIAFDADVQGLPRLFIVGVAAGGLQRIGPDSVFVQAPSWSPDGKRLAFRGQEGQIVGVYVMDAGGSHVRPLAIARPGLSFDSYLSPAWSPDGSRLLFVGASSAFGASMRHDIHVINADGSGERDLANDPAAVYSPTWSPDGQSVAFLRHREAGPDLYDLIVMKADGSAAHALRSLGLDGLGLTWSPDGTKIIAYTGPDPAFEGPSELEILDVAGGPPALLPAPRVGRADWQRLAP